MSRDSELEKSLIERSRVEASINICPIIDEWILAVWGLAKRLYQLNLLDARSGKHRPVLLNDASFCLGMGRVYGI